LSSVIAHSSNPCAIRESNAAERFVKIAVAIGPVASELLCEFVRKFGRAMVTAAAQKKPLHLLIHSESALRACR